MLAAELAGKITAMKPPHERMEDVLTSNVLSSFRYLNNLKVINEFFSRATNINGETLKLGDITEYEAFFWPKFHFTHTGNREPDAVLMVRGSEGNTHVLVVEAKLDSGLHNADNSQSQVAEEDEFALGHQLTDQFCGLRCGIWANSDITKKIEMADKKYLIYLTAHYSCPQADLETTVSEIKARNNSKGCSQDRCNNAEDMVFWLSWQELYDVLTAIEGSGYIGYSRGEKALLEDLGKVLSKKKLMPLKLWEGSLTTVVYYENNFDNERPADEVQYVREFFHAASLPVLPDYIRNFS